MLLRRTRGKLRHSSSPEFDGSEGPIAWVCILSSDAKRQSMAQLDHPKPLKGTETGFLVSKLGGYLVGFGMMKRSGFQPPHPRPSPGLVPSRIACPRAAHVSGLVFLRE